MNNALESPYTTIIGILSIIVSALTLFGVIGPEEGPGLTEYATGIVEAVAGIVAIFKAKDKEE